MAVRRRSGAALVVAFVLASATAATATPPGTNGKLAFRRYLDPSRTWGAIFTIDPDGTGLRQVTHPARAVSDVKPDWSPDGRAIVFLRIAANGCGTNCETDDIVVGRRDGSSTRRIAFDPPGKGCHAGGVCRGIAAWSPDGRRLAFACDEKICVVNSDGSGLRALPQDQPSGLVDGNPTWSPNGKLLAFNRGVRSEHAVFVTAADGRDQRRKLARAVDLVVRHGDIWAADGGTPGYTPLGVGPGTLLHYSPGPRWQTVRVGPPTYNAPEDDTTIAADGRSDVVWAGNEDTRTLTELDAAGGTKLLTIHGIAPGGLAVIRRGDADTVWATDARAGTVVRIDEAAKRVTARVRIGGRPTRIAADGRDLWIVVPAPRRLLVRIDQVTGRVVARIPLPVIPMRVAIGVGAVWVSGYRWSNGVDAAHGGAVLRIDPASDRIVAHIPLGDVAADGVIVADGRVWVAVPPSA